MKDVRSMFFAVMLFTSLCNCSTESTDSPSQKNVADTLSQTNLLTGSITDCDIIYDTIKNEKYKMHLLILEKYNHFERRGYVFDKNGNQLNNFLYHQDIAVFANQLDSTEGGLYKKLTNKVIFLILEHDPQMLDYGLTQWTKDIKGLDYFMEHVSHPTCNTIPIDSLVSLIQAKMGEPNEGAKKVKQMILDNLKKSKQ